MDEQINRAGGGEQLDFKLANFAPHLLSMPPYSASRSVGSIAVNPTSKYVCPACVFRNVVSSVRRPKKPGQPTPLSTRRTFSTITSVTAINAKKDIPPAFRELYHALSALKREAAVYTNLSQLELALRGLESENAVTRIAALGGADGRDTRRLVKVLLADPLAAEAEWEKQLSGLDSSDGRALLIRYGEKLELDQRYPLLRTLYLPSVILHNHNLEILVQAAGTPSEPTDARTQTYLVPGLETPLSATGRYSTVTYPVHKALILSQGFEGITALLTPPSAGSSIGKSMIMAVVDTPWGNLSSDHQALHPVNAINLERAEEAIGTFRQSLDNSFNYEHAWFDSGLPKVSAWLIEGTEGLPAILKPTVRRLAETLVADVENAIEKEDFEQMEKQASSIVPRSTRELMSNLLANWAEAAHTELRNQLDLAFAGKNWRKLAWWKLGWRVDDVTHITSDILRQSWLVDADRGIVYLAGRIEQAGLLPSSVSADTKKPDFNPYAKTPANSIPSESSTFAAAPEKIMFSDMFPASAPSPITHPLSLSSLQDYPIPSIAQHRQHLLSTTIPPLQSLAQRLLLQALSTTALTSTLSALVYVSVSTTSVYEAGTVAALGAVLGMRRLQKRWEAAREMWMGSVREDGRRVLRAVEEG
ncbi:MAG: hypothetical protein LQ348_007124, partial [Seirophora lacunosa]